MARREDTTAVSENGDTPRLVHSEPVLDTVTEVLEAYLGAVWRWSVETGKKGTKRKYAKEIV